MITPEQAERLDGKIYLSISVYIPKEGKKFLTCSLVECNYMGPKRIAQTSLTSSHLMYQRKKQLKAWCREHDIPFLIHKIDLRPYTQEKSPKKKRKPKK